MPPSEHHPQRFASNPLHRPVRRQDTLRASNASHVSQQAQISPSNIDVESHDGRNVAVAGATVAIVVVVGTLFFGAAFFLVRYRGRRRKAMLRPFPDDWSWAEVRGHPRNKQQKPKQQVDSNPQPIFGASEEPVPVTCDVDAQAHSPNTLPRSPDIDENHVSSLGSPSKFHLPSFTFTLPSPVNAAPTRNAATSSILDSRRETLFDEYMDAMMGDGSMDCPAPRLDCGRRRRESEDSATINELSWWSNDSGPSSSGLSTPSEKTPVRNLDSPCRDHSDADESDKSGWELLTKMRKSLPSAPPSLNTPVAFKPDSSSVAVRRSFTSPAFFTMVTPPNNSDVCRKPFTPDKRESVRSNYILAFLDRQGKLGLDLMNEALPPPAIMVSPPTASTLNLCRQSMVNLDQFADVVDPWSIAYGVAHTLNATSTPAAFNVDLARRKGDASVIRPPRPPKSRRRTYVQQQVEAC